VIGFTDGSCLAINFWWFGFVHFAPPGSLGAHQMTSRLGPNALNLTAEDLGGLLKNSRGNIKSFLLDQNRIAGIGNAYIHDILFLARLHPLRKVNTLSQQEINALHQAIQDSLLLSLNKGAAWYEKDLFGQPGGFVQEDILIGYREDAPCPNCGTPIQKIRTGSTTSYLCPECQRI
jgi:formamidopyrimidine-DNA glycosylase